MHASEGRIQQLTTTPQPALQADVEHMGRSLKRKDTLTVRSALSAVMGVLAADRKPCECQELGPECAECGRLDLLSEQIETAFWNEARRVR